MNEAFPLGPRRGKCSNSAALLTGVFVCLCMHMYGHLGVIVMLHLCCESLCGLSFCTCSLHVQMLLVCGSGLLVALSVHVIMCVYVLAMSLGVFGSVSECAFQWDCEFACLPLSFCVSFSVCECLDQLLCVIMHFSVRLSVPFHGPQVFITTPVCKNLAGFGVMGWPRPRAGGWLWERGRPGRRPLLSTFQPEAERLGQPQLSPQ